MGSPAKKLMECNSLDDDCASDVKEFYLLLFFLIASAALSSELSVYLSHFSFSLGVLVSLAGLALEPGTV